MKILEGSDIMGRVIAAVKGMGRNVVLSRWHIDVHPRGGITLTVLGSDGITTFIHTEVLA
jgi:hypothetical protein